MFKFILYLRRESWIVWAFLDNLCVTLYLKLYNKHFKTLKIDYFYVRNETFNYSNIEFIHITFQLSDVGRVATPETLHVL